MNTENHYQETDLGNISLNPRGEYNPEESYEYLDLVVLKGGSYVCLAENGATITGISPESGKTTQYWQVITIPGSLTPEYIAMHDRVVNLSEQVDADAEEVRTSLQEVSEIEINVSNLQEQTRQSLLNVQAILAEAGLTLANVVKTTVFLADMGDFAAMNEIYAQFFTEPFPARSAIAVKALPKGALVEIEMVAGR